MLACVSIYIQVQMFVFLSHSVCVCFNSLDGVIKRYMKEEIVEGHTLRYPVYRVSFTNVFISLMLTNIVKLCKIKC